MGAATERQHVAVFEFAVDPSWRQPVTHDRGKQLPFVIGEHRRRAWDLAADDGCLAAVRHHGDAVAVTGGSDGTVRIWDLEARRQVDRIDLPSGVRALDVTAAGEIVAAFGWDIVLLKRTSDGKL